MLRELKPFDILLYYISVSQQIEQEEEWFISAGVVLW